MTVRGGCDEVRGVVIGDYAPPIRWQLYYDDRPQHSHKEGAATEAEAQQAAARLKAQLIGELGGYPCYLFQDDSKWTVRMWGSQE